MKRLILPLCFLPLLAKSQKLTESNYEVSFGAGFTFFEGSTPGARINTMARLGAWCGEYHLHRDDATVCYNGNCYSKRKEHSWNSNQNSNVAWRWDRFSFYMKRSENAKDTKPYIIYQIKQGSGGQQQGGSPPFSFVVTNDILYAEVRWAVSGSLNVETNKILYNLGTVPYDQWNDVVIYFDYKADNTGNLRVWLNNEERVARLNAPNYYLGAGNPYPKVGMYRWVWSAAGYGGSTSESGIIYFDEVARFGATSVYDDVSLTPAPSNIPPTVSIPTPTPTASTSITVTATVDDPDGTIVSYTWTKLSGPNNPSQVGTAANILQLSGMIDGTYVYELEVEDNDGATGTGQVTIVKSNNNPPTVTVGSGGFFVNQNQITANIETTDPEGGGLTYQWTQLSGPLAIISNDTTKNPTFGNLRSGDYEFLVVVTDDQGLTDQVTFEFKSRVRFSQLKYRKGKLKVQSKL